MQPVVRGPCPIGENGDDLTFTHYSQARKALIQRMGEHCSYCEMHLDSSLAVEHVQPKQPLGATQPMPERALAWGNLLLACTNCNSTKNNTDVVLTDYIWPDRDNTFTALVYSEGGKVSAANGPLQAQAEKIIELVGLHKTPDSAEASDRRWLNRREAWDMAQDSLQDLLDNDTPQMRRQIVRTVKSNGYWSVWMTVFKDRPDILAELMMALPGTNRAYFAPAVRCMI
jgi:uncharacterized protein (TIGR02646 family)